MAAQADGDRAKAESALEGVRNEIRVLQKSLERSRAEHANEYARLREVDLQIQAANLEIRTLEKQRGSHLGELAGLERQRNDYLIKLKQRHDQLADQIRASYRLDSQSRLKLILNQDSPAQLSRMLAYYDYINRAQLVKISGLREALTYKNDPSGEVRLTLQTTAPASSLISGSLMNREFRNAAATYSVA